jgi:orotate phosphoribosyltransferase
MPHNLLSLLSAHKGHFRLESGHHGDVWLELESLFLHPERLQPFVTALAEVLSRYEIQGVCGPLAGGAFLAQGLATELKVAFTYTERVAASEQGGLYTTQYRLPAGLRQSVKGKRIALVDDVVNAGSALRATLEEVRRYGAIPVVAGVLLVLGSKGIEILKGEGLPVEALASMEANLWAPEACPLCERGVELTEGN